MNPELGQRPPTGNTQVPLEQATATERRWLESRLADLRALHNTSRASYAEVVVADVLPEAQLAFPWSPYDLIWQEIRIQVKCSGALQAWHGAETTPCPITWACKPTKLDIGQVDHEWPGPEPRRRGDVWVFARHEGADISTGWTFRVVPLWWLNKFDYRSVTVAKLSDWRPVDTATLADSIWETPRADPQRPISDDGPLDPPE